MKKDGKYRFSLQFSENTEENKRVGELLERLGNHKSALVVQAVNEYITNHPELQNEDCKIQIMVTQAAMPDNLENLIQDMIEKRMAGLQPTAEKIQIANNEEKENSLQDDDISQMLDNLDFFQ